MCPIVWLRIMDAVKLNCISLRVSKRQTIEHIPVTVYLSALAFDLVPFECFHTRTKLSLFTPTTHNIFLLFFSFQQKRGSTTNINKKTIFSRYRLHLHKSIFCCSYPKRCYYYYYMWGKQKNYILAVLTYLHFKKENSTTLICYASFFLLYSLLLLQMCFKRNKKYPNTHIHTSYQVQ